MSRKVDRFPTLRGSRGKAKTEGGKGVEYDATGFPQDERPGRSGVTAGPVDEHPQGDSGAGAALKLRPVPLRPLICSLRGPGRDWGVT